MEQRFEELTAALFSGLTGDELLLASLRGEDSDFVRFNHGSVRQAGQVRQDHLELSLVVGQRQAGATLTLTGQAGEDLARARVTLVRLRTILPSLPEDPHLLVSREPQNTRRVEANGLPPVDEALDAIGSAGSGLDLVGIWASGTVRAGFANSLGQRNWFQCNPFHFDWSLYHAGDKATKSSYAGFEWDAAELGRKVEAGRRDLEILARPARRIEPGRYRAVLSPSAVSEVVGLMCWGGFSARSQRTRRSPLQQLVDGRSALDSRVSLREEVARGVAPAFDGAGFVRPDSVELIQGGAHAASLVSARSAKEYGLVCTGAGGGEYPDSVVMDAGALPAEDLLAELGDGLYISNLWYLNYSDRPGGRMTGMTRFATLWVQDGKPVEPVEVMRFDDTVYRIFGEALVGLGDRQELLLDAGSYDRRSTASVRVPSALVDGLTFTL